MSDFSSDPMPPGPPSVPPLTPASGPFGQQTPLSPAGSYQPPPSAQSAYPPAGYPPAGFPPGSPPPVGYMPVPGFVQKPPRPPVRVGSLLLIVGGVMLIVGSFLNWYTVFGEDINGFYTDFLGQTNDGPVFVFFGVLALGFGIAQLAARKVLAVAILAVVFASFSVLVAIADVSDLNDLTDTAGDAASTGPGLWVILVGSLVALGGAIATLSARRRWPTAA